MLASQLTYLPGQAVQAVRSGPCAESGYASDGTAGHRQREGEEKLIDKDQAGVNETLLEGGLAKYDQRNMA